MGYTTPPPAPLQRPTPCSPSPDKSEAVPLTDRWSPQLTDRAMRFMFSGRPEPAAAPARGAARRRGSHFEGRRDTSSRGGDRRTALMMAFFLTYRKPRGGQHWDAQNALLRGHIWSENK